VHASAFLTCKRLRALRTVVEVMSRFRRSGSAGDQGFAEFFESAFGTVARSVLLVVGDRETAYDITQDASIKGWRTGLGSEDSTS
jgi:hypothetical protein